MLDRGVVGFHFRSCRAGDHEDFNLLPPLQTARQSRFASGCGLNHQGLQTVFRGGSVGEGSGGQRSRELFLDHPRGLQLPRGVICGEHGAEPVPCPAVHGDVGAPRPMHCTSVGKAYLAALPADERDQILSKIVHHHAFTPKTITTRAALEEEIQRTIERGWSEDHGEIDPSSTCCGAAIRDNMGRPVAAISVAGVTDRIKPELSRIGAVVASTAEAISRRLGYDPAINYYSAPAAGTRK